MTPEPVHLRVRSWPLEVVNGQPLDPEFIAEGGGRDPRAGGRRPFTGFSQDAFPATSMPALALAAVAYDVDVATGEAVSLELRDLLFEQGRDIADADVLAGWPPATASPLDPADPPVDRAHADHAEGKVSGACRARPTFHPAGALFCPSLDISRGTPRVTCASPPTPPASSSSSTPASPAPDPAVRCF